MAKIDKLSIIIPFVNEYPQILFTLQSVITEAKTLPIDFEIMVIDNYCTEVGNQILHDEETQICPFCFEKLEAYRVQDKGSKAVFDYSQIIPELQYLKFDRKLSHWNAKNTGVSNSTGNLLLFLDAHVYLTPGSLKLMYAHIKREDKILVARYFPLTYLLDFRHQLKYKIDTDPKRSFYGYQFTGYDGKSIEEVPCMSTCGMIIYREVYDMVGGWPTELGIYGGGENFMNYTLAVMGIKKYVYPVGPICHYAEKRGYYFNYDDFIRNRAIASYMVSGAHKDTACWNYLNNCQGDKAILRRICDSIVTNENIRSHHHRIADNQEYTIDEWLAEMKERKLWDGTFCTKQYVS